MIRNSQEFGSLEQHFGGILENNNKILRNYRNYLLHIYDFLRESSDLEVKEGDYCIRFNITSDSYGLNKNFFLYEIGDVTRRVLWRSLLRSKLGLSFFLLYKEAIFLPSYSYSLDRPTTFIYWGEKQFLFDPNQLKKLKLESFMMSVDKPSQVSNSLANLIWPKSISKIYKNSNIVDLTKNYLLNALFPPKMTNISDIWSEAPFVIIGNNVVELFTIHKTICSLDHSNIRKLGNGFTRTFANILDSNLSIRRVHCYIPSDSLQQIRDKPVTEAIVSKYFRIYKPGHPSKSFCRLSLYPFESAEIFKGEIPGIFATAAFIVLRSLYFRSDELIRLKPGLLEIRNLILQIFRHKSFSRCSWETIDSRILESLEGTRILLELLGVYKIQANRVTFIHPSLIECVYSFLNKIHNLSYNEIKIAAMLLAEIINSNRISLDMDSIFNVQEIFEKNMGLRLTFKDARDLLGSLRVVKDTIIPLSKQLNNPYLGHYPLR
jgi:hypothetical protein